MNTFRGLQYIYTASYFQHVRHSDDVGDLVNNCIICGN